MIRSLRPSISFRSSTTARKIATMCGVEGLNLLRDKDLWGLVTREKKPVYQEWVPNPAPNAGTANIPENIPNPQSRVDFAISESGQKWKKSKETASSLLMNVLGDDIVNDLMNELGDPAAMWKTLEDTYSSKTGTNILTITNGVVTKKLGRNERMSTHIGHSDGLFHQLTNTQGSDEAKENGQKKDLTITGDTYKICMPLASITEVGEYDESYNEKHPGGGSIFDHKRYNHHSGNHRHGQSVRVALAKDDKSNITCYNCNKVGHYTNECRSKQKGKGKSSKISARYHTGMYYPGCTAICSANLMRSGTPRNTAGAPLSLTA
jgi:hypothetical protein